MRRFARIAALLRRRHDDVIADVDAEIDAHIEARVRRLVESGLSPEDARVEALRRFGDIAATRSAMYASAHRHVVRTRRRDQLAAALGDLRVSLRQLRRSPAFAIGVVVTLSLGIAANAAMFDILDRLLLRRALWPGRSALGKCGRIGGADSPCSEVVGVAANIHQYDVRREAALQYWIPEPPNQRESDGPFGVMVRVRTPAELITTIRKALASLTPANAFVTVRPVGDSIDRVVRPWRLGAVMFGVFGAIGLLIAAVGLYSVLAYTVDQRQREIGIRVALGAVTAGVTRLVVAQTLMVTTLGIAVGLVVATAAAPWLGTLLIGVGPRDPIVLSVVASTLLLTAIAASLVPAWRAARVDPAQALRAD